MTSLLYELIGRPQKQDLRGEGASVSQLDKVWWGDISVIEQQDWVSYSTCRGHMRKEQLTKLLEVIVNESGAYSADDSDEAICDGLWDLLCHQYTLYSVTPLFLDFLLTSFHIHEFPKSCLRDFVKICARGSKAIYLTAEEIQRNKEGSMLLFRIEDVLSKHGISRNFYGTDIEQKID